MPNIVDLRIRNEIETEAAAWIVQLHGKKPTRRDLRALADWLNRSPYHREAIGRLATVWDDANALTALLNEAERAPRAAATPRARVVNPLAAAATAAALVLAAFCGYALFGAPAPRTYETAIGEQETIRLADGSSVVLNTDSVVLTEYSPRERVVRLARGEALFDVAPDPSRPFLVRARGKVFRAVGTVFAVRLKGSGVELTVSEGLVEITGGSAAPQRVTALHAARISGARAELRTLDEDALSRSLAWRNGFLAFKGETLGYVVSEVTRYTPTEFVFENPALRDMRIGGYFPAGEVDGLIAALEDGFGVDVRRDAEGRVILSGGDRR